MKSTKLHQNSARLVKSLHRAEQLTSVPIEVLIFSNTSRGRLVKRVEALARNETLLPEQALIGVDPVNRHVVLALGHTLKRKLKWNDLKEWLHAFQEDLHMTAFENAVAMAVVSLAVAFSPKFPRREQTVLSSMEPPKSSGDLTSDATPDDLA